MAATGEVLTEAQVVALERKQDDDAAHGEIETAHPGYPGSQDMFYVGTLKGVGRVYQQTFVDTYSKWAACKLYTTKTPITSADLLNDRVFPFFAEQATWQLFKLTRVHIPDQLGDGDIQFGQTKEAPIAQPCQNPALHNQHAILDLGFIARLAWACG